MTARTTRRKKPAPPTAHVGYQPAAPRTRERYHAVADQAVQLGQLTRDPGQALCGLPGPWPAAPPALFAPLVSCRACQALADSEHITITGSTP